MKTAAADHKKKWSRLQIEYIGECFLLGDTVTELAVSFGVGRGKIAGLLNRHGYFGDEDRRRRKRVWRMPKQ